MVAEKGFTSSFLPQTADEYHLSETHSTVVFVPN